MSKRNYLYFLLLSALFFSPQSNYAGRLEISNAFRTFGKSTKKLAVGVSACVFVNYIRVELNQKKLERKKREELAAAQELKPLFKRRDGDNDGRFFA